MVRYVFSCDGADCERTEMCASESLPDGWFTVTRVYEAGPLREVRAIHLCSIACAGRGVNALAEPPADIKKLREHHQRLALPPRTE